MSEIRVDKIQGTSGTATALTLSGANSTVNGTLNVDGAVTLDTTLSVTGVHTVGTNAVATSDGGAATTSIVQGLAKAWINHNQATVHDSFNVGSLTDNGTGDYGLNFTNNMGNIHYSGGGFGVHDGGSYTGIGPQYDHDDPFTTSQATYNYQNVSQGVLDVEPATAMIVGDLA